MTSSKSNRLLKELAEITKDESSGVNAKLVAEGDLTHLIGTLQGPKGTVYEGGVYDVDIKIPKQYPFEPPKMKYITKIWHPNISSQTGAICLVSFYCLRLFVEDFGECRYCV
jgi:ubiquitin-conjugating enzyme (huntingtin interacting protein 2)